MAESFSLYLFMVAIALIGPQPLAGRHRGEAVIHLWLAVALLLLSKPNTSYPAIGFCFLILFRSGIGMRMLLPVFAAASWLAL